jgi:hypothetical protein
VSQRHNASGRLLVHWPQRDLLGERVQRDGRGQYQVGDQISVNGQRVQRVAYCFVEPRGAVSDEDAERREQ